MKKKIIAVITMVVVIAVAFLIGTGFRKRTDVVLFDYSVSEDGAAINLGVQVSSSMGYELVLVKDEETEEWIRPGERSKNAEEKEVFTIEKLISLCDEGREALENAMTNFDEAGELTYSDFEKNISEHSLTWDYFCYVQYEDREYRIQASYWKPEIAKDYGHIENELDFIYIFYPTTNDGLLLYEADERFIPNLDIRSLLEKEYDLSLEVELELPEELTFGNYQMDLVMGQGCLFVGDFEEEAHGEGTPQDWYAPGGIVFISKEDFPGDIVFEKGKLTEVSIRMNHSGITSDIDRVEGCNKQAVLCEYSCDLFTAAEAEEYMQINKISVEEFHGNSEYWYVLMTEEDDEKVYTLFLNQKYFSKEDILELARSIRFT